MTEKNSKPTFKRQRFLLSFMRQLNEGVTATEMQKLVFLHSMKENSDYYEFVPYKYGPYSFQLAEDVSILCRDEYLYKQNSRIHATGQYQREPLFYIADERGDDLLRKTYREYPYYAINSEILDRLFNRDESDRFRRKKQTYSHQDQTLFTIGYEGRSAEAFMNTLIQNDVRLLCDVRRNPISRKFGFSKNRLKSIASGVGIKYIHIPNLGIESKKRAALTSTVDYRFLFDDYAKTLPDLKPYLEKLYSLLRSENRIALMCYEKEPDMCHRHVIRDYLVSTYETRSVDL